MKHVIALLVGHFAGVGCLVVGAASLAGFEGVLIAVGAWTAIATLLAATISAVKD